MRVFTFFLMMAVAVGGGAIGYRLITGRDLLSPAALGLMQLAEVPTVVPTPRPSIPTSLPVATLVPTPSPATATPVPDTPQIMVVGNTDGQGVFLRRTPHLDDKLKPWVDGSKMEIVGAPVDSDGHRWMKVRAPDGAEGYIPLEYLVEAQR